MAFMDLDGTLISKHINNTYDFIRAYISLKGDKIRLTAYKLLVKIISFLPLNCRKKVEKYVWLLTMLMLFYGYNKSELERFAKDFWTKYVRRYVNTKADDLLKKLKNEGFKVVLLTRCVEVPATQLAEFFGFDSVICSKFKVKNGKIKGISLPIFAEDKVKILYKLYPETVIMNSVYIVDYESLIYEKINAKIFKKVYLIKEDSMVE